MRGWRSRGAHLSLGDPELRRGGARVLVELGLARPDRPRVHDPELRLAATAADWQVGRTDTAPRGLPEPLLDQAVLERVEADDRDPPARVDQLEGQLQALSELPELVVDLDPQGLERPLRRVALAEAGGRRDRLLDGLDEV